LLAVGAKVTAVVATLFETGHYEAGAAALLNSLVAAGFRGRVWCGIRGAPPAWLEPSAVRTCVGDAITIRTVPVATPGHLTMYKPHFMTAIAQEERSATSLVYFDPDIVVKCGWPFIDRWCARGIAAIADPNWCLPASSPVRADWDDVRRDFGLGLPMPERSARLELYCNGGFVGVSKACEAFWTAWQDLIDTTCAAGPTCATALSEGRSMGRVGDWHLDQDLLNMALMDWGHLAHLMGPEAMDFAPGGDVLSHATGTPKPWQRHFIRGALSGRAPSKSNREYLRYAAGPFQLHSPRALRRKLYCYKAARALGTVARRVDH
jgi:hypothetical protein